MPRKPIPKSSILPAPTQLIPDNEERVPEEITREVMDRGEAGDETVTEDVRRLLRRANKTVSVTVQSPLARAIEANAGKNIVVKEACVLQVEEMKKGLEGPDPSPLEKMLVDRVVTCWYLAREAEHRYIMAVNRSDGITLTLGDYHQRTLNACQKRYNAAVMTLAKVRKLQLPDVTIDNKGQVNIGGHQTNVAQPAPIQDEDIPHGSRSHRA